MSRTVRVVDLFAGVGGLAVGLRRTARALDLTIDHLWAVDTDRAALAIYQANHQPAYIYPGPVSSFLNGELGRTEPVDLLLGGPPCQAHSIANAHRRRDDHRRSIYGEMADAALKLNAAAVVIENVPHVVHDTDQVVTATEQRLVRAGYHVTMGVLRAHRMGAPQARTRHFLVARRDRWPTPITSLEATFAASPVTAAELLAQPTSDDPTMRRDKNYGPTQQARIDYLHDEDEYELPPEHLPPSKRRTPEQGQFRHFYGRLYPDRPIPTVMGSTSGPSNGRWVHPTKRRCLTLGERAAAQEFPVDYQWRTPLLTPTYTQIQGWLGNAVPATLGHVATWCALA